MPLIVDVQPIGPRVVLMNKAIELGVSYALEGGADGIMIPWPGYNPSRPSRRCAAACRYGSNPKDLELDDPELVEAMDAGRGRFLAG